MNPELIIENHQFQNHMIKTIKISALISSILLVSGVLFKSQHFLGANVIFIIGAAVGVLTAILMISSFIGNLSSGLEKFNIIFASSAVIIVLLGFLFKIMHWPGAAKLIWIADLGIAISGILFLVDGLREKDPAKSVLKIITMFFIFFLLMLIVLTT